MQELIKRYKKGAKYMDNESVDMNERLKHLDRFVALTKELGEKTKDMSLENIKKLMDW